MKTDLTKDDAYRARVGAFRILELPVRRYLAIDGHGDPNTDVYRRAIEAMYPVAYRVKFASKAAGRDYVVPPLEALWTAEDPSLFTTRRDKSMWDWTLLTALPEWATPDDVVPHLEGGIRLETLDEGLCVQTLHVGPYDDEGPCSRGCTTRSSRTRGFG